MKTITFVTGNLLKFKTARHGLAAFPLQLEHKAMETPEIQAFHSEEIARFSAQYAFEHLQSPLFVTDVSYEIPALGNFPGPFIKYINSMLSATQMLDLMQNVTDRRIVITECLAYIAPGTPVQTFTSHIDGTIATEAKGNGSPINQILILDGMATTLAITPEAEQLAYWQKALTHYHQLGEWLSTHS